MSFRPIVPGHLPRLAELAAEAVVAEGDARAALVEACSGAAVPAGEVVVWAWTFDAAFTHTLLVDHPGHDALLPPGGRLERDEHPREAVLRELREETGLDAPLVQERPALLDVVRGSTPDGQRYQTFGLAFVVVADPSIPLVGEPGQEPRWVPLDVRPDRARRHHWERLERYVRSR